MIQKKSTLLIVLISFTKIISAGEHQALQLALALSATALAHELPCLPSEEPLQCFPGEEPYKSSSHIIPTGYCDGCLKPNAKSLRQAIGFVEKDTRKWRNLTLADLDRKANTTREKRTHYNPRIIKSSQGLKKGIFRGHDSDRPSYNGSIGR